MVKWKIIGYLVSVILILNNWWRMIRMRAYGFVGVWFRGGLRFYGNGVGGRAYALSGNA